MASSATSEALVMWWAVVAFACLGLRVLGVIAVGARRVPVWSGPVAEVLLGLGGPALVDRTALGNLFVWLGLLALTILWAPVIALARRTPTARSPRVALVVAAVLALATQAALAQGHIAGTVSAATTGQVCQFPRKTVGISGDLYPAPRGTTLDLCVQGRPGGGYLGDGWGPSCQQVHGRCEHPDPAQGT